MPDTISFVGIADPVSALTHLFGALLFGLLGTELLKRGRGNDLRVLSLRIYVLGVVFALLASGLLHVVDQGTAARSVLARIDHAAIFFLIAATYTPIHIIEFRGWLRWGVLTGVWSAASAGIIVKTFYFQAVTEHVGLLLYLGLGWCGLISAGALYRVVGPKPLIPVAIGAFAYTIGAVLDAVRFPTLIPGVLGPHEIFHLFVLLGVAAHWTYIRRITISAPITDLYTIRSGA